MIESLAVFLFLYFDSWIFLFFAKNFPELIWYWQYQSAENSKYETNWLKNSWQLHDSEALKDYQENIVDLNKGTNWTCGSIWISILYTSLTHCIKAWSQKTNNKKINLKWLNFTPIPWDSHNHNQ